MNINEIAQMAGVSRATVSRYLNDGYVSEDKKARIRAVIAETGYSPSLEARTMRTKKTNRIAVILPRINSDSISRMVQGVSRVLATEGYQLLLMNTGNDIAEELRCLESVRENMVDGVVFFATLVKDKHKKALRKLRVPVVVLGQKMEGFSCIYHDNRSAGQAIGALMGERCKKPAYLGITEEDRAVGYDRYQGVAEGLRSKGVDPDGIPNVTADFSADSGYRAARQLLEAHPEVDGICCATDSIAAGAMKYLRETGVRSGECVKVSGFGDSNLSRLVDPELTTVHFYYKTSGEEAARLILERIAHPDAPVKQLQVGYELVIRATL